MSIIAIHPTGYSFSNTFKQNTIHSISNLSTAISQELAKRHTLQQVIHLSFNKSDPYQQIFNNLKIINLAKSADNILLTNLSTNKDTLQATKDFAKQIKLFLKQYLPDTNKSWNILNHVIADYRKPAGQPAGIDVEQAIRTLENHWLDIPQVNKLYIPAHYSPDSLSWQDNIPNKYLIFISQLQHKHYTNRVHDKNTINNKVINNPIPLSFREKALIRMAPHVSKLILQKHFQQTDMQYLLWAGRFNEQKNPELAIQSFIKGHRQQLANKQELSHLILIGSIEDKQLYAQLQKKYQVYFDSGLIKHIGKVPRETLLALMTQSQANLFPYTGIEAFGLLPVESALAGLTHVRPTESSNNLINSIPPAIGFTGSLSPEVLVNDMTGYTIPQGNNKAYMNKVSQIMAKPFLYKLPASPKLQTHLSKFTLQSLTEQYYKLLNQSRLVEV